MMSESELKEVELRYKKTTKGPWVSFIEGRDHESGDSFIMTGIEKGENIWDEKRGEDIYITGINNYDQDFIASARQDIPKLIKEIRKLKKINE